MSGLKVLIVGASIAGPTAAYWFAKAGAKVTIIERFPNLRTNGQAVDIRTVGVTVMRKMPGLEDAVRAKRAPGEGISFVRADGRPYGVVKPTGNPDQQSLISEYEIFRGDLGQILFDMTKDNENIRYVFGEQVASMQQHGEGDGPITVEFLHGFPTSDYDLVVACDGATSRTRAIGLGCGVRDHIRPTYSLVAYFSLPRDILNGSQIGQAYSAVGGRTIAIGPDPSGGNRVVFMGAQPRNNETVMQPFREAIRRGDDATKQFLAQHCKDMAWKCEEALKGMMEADDFYAVEVVQVHTPSLYKGHFVMVGDAGYAPGPTGNGTTLAMTGAYVLAGEISKHNGDLAAGLRGYEERMRPIIKDLQKIPPLVPAILAPYTAWGLWLRNTIFAIICWTGITNFAQKHWGSAFAETDKYKLPEYEWV
ncbi:FAD/NAD(P)-binding domain-containing protein [Coniochaeta ligniaria NRRL 30616]|uniref:FAD/NAD(P)-binding domain-containing protein n=1 Tax=Coniochaeta ligniaria NRRL 30616 TaxID=1408157 RepID=A0A1J7J040_9PEZI|nr:FAD/NAD(P)-binding domain-containing protein [Coniochaeta ligniaria NRRL 30616]